MQTFVNENQIKDSKYDKRLILFLLLFKLITLLNFLLNFT
jgi:hypothetical protein